MKVTEPPCWETSQRLILCRYGDVLDLEYVFEAKKRGANSFLLTLASLFPVGLGLFLVWGLRI